MQPMFSGEMGAARATEMRERAAHARKVKQAKAATAARRQESGRQLEEIRTPRVLGILPWRSVGRGRAVGKVRTRTAAEPC